MALEVKLDGVPGPASVRHLLWLREQPGDDLLDAAVITAGAHAYRHPDGIAVIPCQAARSVIRGLAPPSAIARLSRAPVRIMLCHSARPKR
jgi:hypothetical protein